MAQRGIDIALDLSRMPALARECGSMPIPSDIAEVLEVAAGDESACRSLAMTAGTTPDAVIDAVRFYLQHLLFPTGADCYRVLGLAPGASRGTARRHMKLLLRWLHPDRNGGLESMYAERVIDAWRTVADQPEQQVIVAPPHHRASKSRVRSRPPLLEIGVRAGPKQGISRFTLFTAGLLVLVAGVSLSYYVAPRLYDPLFDWKP